MSEPGPDDVVHYKTPRLREGFPVLCGQLLARDLWVAGRWEDVTCEKCLSLRKQYEEDPQ